MVDFSDLFDCEIDEFQKKAKVSLVASKQMDGRRLINRQLLNCAVVIRDSATQLSRSSSRLVLRQPYLSFD